MKHNFKRLWIVALSVYVLFLSLITIHACTHLESTGLQKHKSYGLLFNNFSDGYSSIHLDAKSYNAEDVISFTVSAAFFDKLADAKGTENVRLYAMENEVFDISFSVGQPIEGLDSGKIGLGLQDTYWLQELPCEGIDPKDLVRRWKMLNSFIPVGLNFSFDVYLKVKEDAPENYTGVIEVWGNAYAGTDSFGNRIGDSFVMDYLYFSKQGDQILFH